MSLANTYLTEIEQRNAAARAAESTGDLAAAIELYEENIRLDYKHEFAFNRLLVIYRKQKKFKQELRVINRGIRVFSEVRTDHMKHLKNRKQVQELSNAFMTKAGLKDKKGNSTYFPQPVDKWMRRKTVVEKKIKPAPSKK
jgi:tetratricopeptide (TPR) repeat protein